MVPAWGRNGWEPGGGAVSSPETSLLPRAGRLKSTAPLLFRLQGSHGYN